MRALLINIFKKFIYKIRVRIQWLLRQEGSPGERSRGIACGVFSGCFPLFGLQTFLGVALASLFKGNRLLAAVSTWVSNPLTYLPIYWFNYKIGSWLIDDKQFAYDSFEITLNVFFVNGLSFAIRLFLGSTVNGLLLAILIGCSAYFILRRQ